MLIIESETFKNKNYTTTPLPKGEYENCEFTQCNFLNADLSQNTFVDCVFSNCNISNANIDHTAFKTVEFIECKILGIDFSRCNPFLLALRFSNCQLNFSSFYQLNLKNTLFSHNSLQEVDFTESNLTSSTFKECDLLGAIFENCILEKVDFRTAQNFCVDLNQNKVKNAHFSSDNLSGLVDKYAIKIS